jgi:hypothetical protein
MTLAPMMLSSDSLYRISPVEIKGKVLVADAGVAVGFRGEEAQADVVSGGSAQREPVIVHHRDGKNGGNCATEKTNSARVK